MEQEIKIPAEIRQITTKSVLKEYRKKGILPAVAYGSKIKTMYLWVKDKIIEHLIKETSVEGTIFYLVVDGKEYPVVIKEIQKDPLTDKPIHVDFHVISLKEEIEVKVPIHLKGEEEVLKHTGGIIDFPLREVRIKCLPKNIPQYIEVDISNLKIGQAITVKDIPQEKFVILEPPDSIIVHVLSRKKEETPTETVVTQTTEPEVISKGKKEEKEE
jgi:large subunit ribosomal protein L25